MSCHLLDRGSLADCDNIPEAGTQARLILINWDQVSHIYVNDDGKIVAIQFRGTSYKGYEFLGFKQDVKKSEGVVKTNLKNRFTHSVEFVVYEVTQEQKNNLKKMSKGRFMAIVELNGKQDYSIELLGRYVGLKMSSGQIKDAHENGGVYKIVLNTPDNGIEFELKLPQVVGTSYADGLEIIEDVITSVIPPNALLAEDGTPILNENGDYILVETAGEGIFDFTFDETFE